VSLCAICVEDGACRPEVIDGRAVRVCGRCSGEHPRAGGYGFEPTPRRRRDGGNVNTPGCQRIGTGQKRRPA